MRKMVSIWWRTKVMILAAFALWLGATHAAEIQVYAAASLTDPLTEIGKNYEEASEDKPVFNFAASNLLARQIQEGASADVFLSADEEKMDGLEKKGLIIKETRKSLLSNTLVIVAEKGSRLALKSPKELAGTNIKKIALAESQSVPAGIYAKKYLKSIGIWDQVIDRVIPTENVRAAMAAVEYGNVDAGIVYKTDAAISKKTKIVYEVPLAECPKISYPLAVTSGSKESEAAKRFVEYLASPEGIHVFKKFGFIVPEPAI
jgi:molybdate transport system substrate-binding protein